MLVQATEYKESFNHKKMKSYVQMQSVGLIPPSPFCPVVPYFVYLMFIFVPPKW